MINEHISKDSFPQDICPKGYDSCSEGYCTCRYHIDRFGIEPFNSMAAYVRNKIHNIELEKRKSLNIKSWDYKSWLDKRRYEQNE